VLVALARTGHSLAGDMLRKSLSSNPNDDDLAFALSQLRGPVGDHTLDELLGSKQTERAAIRIAIVRWLNTRRAPSRLDDAVDRLLRSKAREDRRLAQWASAWLHPETVQGAARAQLCSLSLAMPPALERSCRQLVTPKAGVQRLAASCAALTLDRRGPSVTDELLFRWAEASTLTSTCLLRFLGARRSESNDGRILDLLDASDPVVRAQVAIGLAASNEPSAVSLLRSRFMAEPTAMVRAAMIRGLSGHLYPSVVTWLARAARLDPDPVVRSLARAAAAGRRLDTFQPGDHVVWAHVTVTDNDKPELLARLVTPSGWAFVVPVSSDGTLLVAGLPTSRVQVTVQDARFGSGGQ
jgi:hypothetical protein